MRIIGGSVGGRAIRAPRGQATRPTADRVREAIFNILGPPPEGTRVLDLFAGSGALGLEALSRGAEQAVFVDQAAGACRVVRENLESLGLAHRGRVVRADANKALDRLRKDGQAFRWVFRDPPYARIDEAARLLDRLGGDDAALLDDDAVVLVEHDRRRVPADAHGALARTDRRRYGDTEVSFYVRMPP